MMCSAVHNVVHFQSCQCALARSDHHSRLDLPLFPRSRTKILRPGSCVPLSEKSAQVYIPLSEASSLSCSLLCSFMPSSRGRSSRWMASAACERKTAMEYLFVCVIRMCTQRERRTCMRENVWSLSDCPVKSWTVQREKVLPASIRLPGRLPCMITELCRGARCL